MFQEQYKKLELKQTGEILESINPKLDVAPFDSAITTILSISLPFYKGYDLLDIADHTINPPKRAVVLYNGKTKDAVIFDWTNGPVYALNDRLPVALNEKNIEEYVRFFFAYVRGKHGRFVIVENVDDIAWKEDPPPAARRAISKMITPVSFENREGENTYHLKACMMFRDSLFRTDIYVEPDGRTRMANEELLIEDMPVLDDVFGQ